MRTDFGRSSFFPFRRRTLLWLLALCLVGCGSESERLVEDKFEKVIPVDPSARLSIKNTDGSIHLYGANTREIKIEATKKAYGRERLQKISINVTATSGSVAIDTVYPARPKLGLADRSGTVDYDIVVPADTVVPRLELATGEVILEGLRGGKVNATLVNGRMFDRNGFGEHQLLVVNGGLDVIFDWWEKKKFSVDARIVNGNLRSLLPSESAFHLVAAAEDGRVENDFQEQENRKGAPLQKIDTVVGQGGEAEIKLQATNGSIRIIEANP